MKAPAAASVAEWDGAQLWALDMAVDAEGAPVTDRSAVDLAFALARPLDGSLPPSAFVVPWAGAQLALVAGEGGGEGAAAAAAAASGRGAAFYSVRLQLPAAYAGPVTVGLSPEGAALLSEVFGAPATLQPITFYKEMAGGASEQPATIPPTV
ncbi:hypothetical protein WJX81_006891 [Elliptochloris bilobata]|uniref:Uncharacterized protein n=1 Tax=Elliptochloris bilobata TaxID=381761 RepID=A0AAW1SAG5_9CHLO